MGSRAMDWFRQALRDIRHSRKSLEIGDYEWSCFSAQQAAEKALKALLMSRGVEVWGHDLIRLLKEAERRVGVGISEDLIEAAAELDKHYVISRYPNGFSEGAPWEHYTRRDAERCVRAGVRIVEWVKGILQGAEEQDH